MRSGQELRMGEEKAFKRLEERRESVKALFLRMKMKFTRGMQWCNLRSEDSSSSFNFQELSPLLKKIISYFFYHIQYVLISL